MTYALIIVAKDNPGNPWPDAMHRVLHRMPTVEGVTRLNESAWLVHLDSSLLFLARLVGIAHDEKLAHHVAFFEQKPTFIDTSMKSEGQS